MIQYLINFEKLRNGTNSKKKRKEKISVHWTFRTYVMRLLLFNISYISTNDEMEPTAKNKRK